MSRVYHVQLSLDDNVDRPARLVRANNRAQAERHVMKGCLVTHVATQDDILALYPQSGVEVAGEESSDEGEQP